MLKCNLCGDEQPDPAQSTRGGLHDEGSLCRHLDCQGTYRDESATSRRPRP